MTDAPPAGARERGFSRIAPLLALLAFGATLGVLSLFFGAFGSSGGDASLSHAPKATVAEPGRSAEGMAGLEAAPGSKTREQRLAEEAARAAAAKASFPRSEGIYGFVFDGRGKPVAGAEVKLLPVPAEDLYRWGAPDRDPVATTKTGADGSYLVGPAPPGTLKVRADAEGYAPTTQQVRLRGARVDLVLDRGGALHVAVQDVEGKAIADAQVVHTAGTSVLEKTTDASGQATFPAVPTGTGNLVVYKAGRGAARRNDVAVAPDEKLDVTVILMPPIALTGHVVTSDGDRPIKGASLKVTFTSLPGIEGPPETTTDEDGAFHVDLAIGTGEQVQIVTTAPEFAPAQTWLQVTDSGGRTMDTMIKLGPGGNTISGRVVDERGHGAGGVTVTLAWQAPGKGTPEAKTDDDGHFDLVIPSGGQPGQWWQLFAIADSGAMGSANAATPKPGERANPVTITLSGAGRVTGRVADASGKPLGGTLVSLSVDWGLMQQQQRSGRAPNWMLMNMLQDTRRFALDGVSGDDGRYEIPGVPASVFRITATHGLDVASPSDPVNVESGGTTTVDITLGSGQTIEGRVEDDQGQPVAGAWVNANLKTGNGGWGGRWLSARSQSDGTFVVRGATDGTWGLTAYAGGFGGQEVPNVQPGAKDVVLRLTAMGWIAGTVYADGRPYRGTFSVQAQWVQKPGEGPNRMSWGNQNGSTFNTDDGTFTLKNLAPGRYQVVATTPDGLIASESPTVDVVNGRGAEGLTIALAAGSTLRGTLTEQDGGGPVASAGINVNPKPGPNAPATSVSVQTDSGGRFAARGLAPGVYLLTVNPPSGLFWQQEIEIRQGQDQEVRLTTLVPGRIRVYVTDPDGRPLEGAQPMVTSGTGIQIWPSWQALQREGLLEAVGNSWERVIKTDATGVNVRYHVRPGRYQVSAMLKDFQAPAEAPWVEVASDRVTEVTVVMRPKDAAEPH